MATDTILSGMTPDQLAAHAELHHNSDTQVTMRTAAGLALAKFDMKGQWRNGGVDLEGVALAFATGMATECLIELPGFPASIRTLAVPRATMPGDQINLTISLSL